MTGQNKKKHDAQDVANKWLSLKKVDPALLGVHVAEFFAHLGSPKRKQDRNVIRWQDAVIEREVPEGAFVLDLGCGEGDLLAKLIRDKNVRGQGIEYDPEQVAVCVERGVPVFQIDVDGGTKEFPDNCFDYVVLEETMQTLMRPAEILKEMLRVGKRCIVSFPNFGYWRVRMDLALRGRMPVTEWLPHRWYDTPNIHMFTLQDFIEWAGDSHITIVKGFVLSEGDIREMEETDNLYAEEALMIIERE